MGMTPSQAPLVRETWPIFAAELEAALETYGEPALREQVERLRIIESCTCGDDFCQSFRTGRTAPGPYGEGHRTVSLTAPWQGFLNVDVVDDDIVYVEVLHRSPLD